jgi:hypothetical protein
MTNHNTPQHSRMDLVNHCAASPGLSLLNTRAVYIYWDDIYSVLKCHNVEKHTQFYLGYLGSMWLPLVMQGVSKRALQWCSRCYCVVSVTKAYTLKGVQTIHRSTPCTPNINIWNIIVKLLLKAPCIIKVWLNAECSKYCESQRNLQEWLTYVF